MFRIGHDLYVGQSTLKHLTIIDILVFGESFRAFCHKTEKVSTFDLSSSEEVCLHFTNGIDQPETQDTPKRLMLEGNETVNKSPLKEGTRVKFKTTYKDAELEVVGYIVRNFWGLYYLITEQGVSVPNRYWKVGHDLVEEYQ